MRTASLLRKLIGVIGLVVSGADFTETWLVVEVRPGWAKPRCGGCGRRAPGYDRQAPRDWRHLAQGKWLIWLRYAPRRVACPRCGVLGELVPWAARGSRFTRAFEEMVAYLAQVTDQTAVTKLMGIDWRTVGVIIERVVSRRLDPGRLEGLRRIGIDEFGYRKRHKYLTIVVDHDRKRVVWVGVGKAGKTLRAFFQELGPARAKLLHSVTLDMAEGYIGVVEELAPQARIVFDRFHVQKLASDALDQLRRSIVQELGGPDAAPEIKGSRWALLKNPWDLTPTQRGKLSTVQRINKRLFRGYLLKDTLARALSYRQPARARRALEEWLSWASRSRLRPFQRVARTIRKYFEGILAYIEERLTNGIVEGINNRVRMIARRAYGFHKPESLMGMIFLCCGGITLDPPLPQPTTIP